MTTPEVVVDNNSPPSCAGEIAKIRLASRLASAKSLQIRPNKLQKVQSRGIVAIYLAINSKSLGKRGRCSERGMRRREFESSWRAATSVSCDHGPRWI